MSRRILRVSIGVALLSLAVVAVIGACDGLSSPREARRVTGSPPLHRYRVIKVERNPHTYAGTITTLHQVVEVRPDGRPKTIGQDVEVRTSDPELTDRLKVGSTVGFDVNQ